MRPTSTPAPPPAGAAAPPPGWAWSAWPPSSSTSTWSTPGSSGCTPPRNSPAAQPGCLPRTDLSVQEPCQDLHEPLRIVEPGKVSAARLHGQLGLTEQAGILSGALRGERDVVLARDQQDPRPKAGEGGSGGLRS